MDAPDLNAKSNSRSDLEHKLHQCANLIWNFGSFTCGFWVLSADTPFDEFTDVSGCWFKPYGTFSAVISERFQIYRCKCEE